MNWKREGVGLGGGAGGKLGEVTRSFKRIVESDNATFID